MPSEGQPNFPKEQQLVEYIENPTPENMALAIDLLPGCIEETLDRRDTNGEKLYWQWLDALNNNTAGIFMMIEILLPDYKEAVQECRGVINRIGDSVRSRAVTDERADATEAEIQEIMEALQTLKQKLLEQK
jgi:hypothetical protein